MQVWIETVHGFKFCAYFQSSTHNLPIPDGFQVSLIFLEFFNIAKLIVVPTWQVANFSILVGSMHGEDI